MLFPREEDALMSEAFLKRKDPAKSKAAKKARADVQKEMQRLREQGKEKVKVSDVNRLVHMVYRIPAESVTDDVVPVFQVLRFALFVGLPFIVHPALALVGWMVNKVIEEKVNEKYEGSVMSQYRNELAHVEKRLESESISEEEREALQNTKRTIEEAITKLERHFRTMKAYKDPHVEDTSSSDDDFGFDFSESAQRTGGAAMFTGEDELQEQMILQLNESVDQLIDVILDHEHGLSEAGKVRHAIKSTYGKVERADKRSSEKIDGVADTVIDGGRRSEKKKMREEILNGRLKVSTVVKRAIGLGTVTAINPALGVLTASVFLVRKKMIKGRQKDELLRELKSELEIVEEKIKDSDSDNDKTKKYQYMRLRRELNRSIDKIRYSDTLKDRY